jgi:predicted pyridoxine 5'-phosphate oxidase superfamily flavin-nucleotide-binding protein
VTVAAAPPFHAGELALQERAGMRERIGATASRFLRDHMPEQHRELFEKLPTLLVGSLDAQGQPWASILAGSPGFMRTPDARHLTVAALPRADDPLGAHLVEGAPLGLLGIEPHTRRRNRMNGTVVQVSAQGFTLEVDQSFGNCPQYIQARAPLRVEATPAPVRAQRRGRDLAPLAIALIERADTFFIASAAARARGHAGAHGVDVSHRGGRPGFVQVTEERGGHVLAAPDFRGNFLFNTLGNIAANPRAGLLFIDYERGDVLQLTGTAEIVWDGPQVAAFAGAQRLLRIAVASSLWVGAALPLRWSAPQQAVQLAATGTWREAAAAERLPPG